jgi:hypothetical protein
MRCECAGPQPRSARCCSNAPTGKPFGGVYPALERGIELAIFHPQAVQQAPERTW